MMEIIFGQFIMVNCSNLPPKLSSYSPLKGLGAFLKLLERDEYI